MVGGLHADGDVRDSAVDCFLRAGQRLVGEHHLPAALVRKKIVRSVLPDEAAEALSHIQQPVFGPQIHKAVCGRGAGQADDAADARADLHQRPEAFCPVAFEGRQLVDHHGVEVKGDAALLNEPLDVFPVDHADIRPPQKRRPALGLGAHRHGAGQKRQVIPFLNLGGPCVAGHAERRDYQNTVSLEAVKQQVIQGGQRDARFAEAHIQQDRRDGVILDVTDGIGLVAMGFVFHPEFLQSALAGPARKPESPAAAASGVWLPAGGAAPCPEP